MRSIDVMKGKRFSAREMARAVFFLDRPHRKSGSAIRAAFEAFSSLLPSDRSFSINDPGGDWKELPGTDATRTAVARRLDVTAADPNCSMSVCSNDSNVPDYTFEYRGYALEDPSFREWAGLVFVTFPRNDLHAKGDDFRSIFINLITGLPIFAAYATLSMEGDQGLIQKIAKRYPGLDISSVPSIAKDIGRRAPGAFWLNAYKGELRDAVLRQIELGTTPAGVHVARVEPDIALVLLSSEPTRLDKNAGESPSGYQWLATNLLACGCLHVPRKVTYFEDEDDLEDAEAQKAWHLRFTRADT